NTASSSSHDTGGRLGIGSPAGIAPKVDSMVGVSRLNSVAISVVAVTATSICGTRGKNRLMTMMTPIVATATATVTGLAVGRYCHMTGSFFKIGPGSGWLKLRPSKSLIWLAKIT